MPRVDSGFVDLVNKEHSSARIARETGLSKSGVCRILSGEREPNVSHFRRIAAYLGMSMDELYQNLYGSRDRKTQKPL